MYIRDKIKLKEQKITIKNSNDQQNRWSSSYKIRSRNTFNKTTSTNIRLLMRNEVNNWQKAGFFILTYKAKHNVLASLHELSEQNTIQTVPFVRS